MATTYHYDIVSLHTKDMGDVKDVVKKISYCFMGTDEETGYVADYFGEVVLDDPADLTTLTDYNDLTKEQVESWLIELIDDTLEAEMKAKVDNDIEMYVGYNDVKVLPWAESNETPAEHNPIDDMDESELAAYLNAGAPDSDAETSADEEVDAGTAQDQADTTA